jgi:hypothetical protein
MRALVPNGRMVSPCDEHSAKCWYSNPLEDNNRPILRNGRRADEATALAYRIHG